MQLLPAAGILFDCDGVLVDSAASVTASWGRWAGHFGLDHDKLMSVVHGRRDQDTVAEMLPEGRRDEGVELIARLELYDAHSVRAMPGAAALIRAMPTGRFAVVTSGSRTLATARLRASGIEPPEVMVTADDVTRGKPDPQGYLMAAGRLGLDPASLIVLEDAQAGIDAARGAGVGTVVGVGGTDLRADALIPDLAQARWSDLGLYVA